MWIKARKGQKDKTGNFGNICSLYPKSSRAREQRGVFSVEARSKSPSYRESPSRLHLFWWSSERVLTKQALASECECCPVCADTFGGGNLGPEPVKVEHQAPLMTSWKLCGRSRNWTLGSTITWDARKGKPITGLTCWDSGHFRRSDILPLILAVWTQTTNQPTKTEIEF